MGNEYHKKYYQLNKEKLKQRSAEWRKNNPKPMNNILYTKCCNNCDSEFVTKHNHQKHCSDSCRQKFYRKKNKEKIKEYNKKYHKKYGDNNKVKKREYDKIYYQKNKDKINKKFYNKLNEDTVFKLKHNLRNLISNSIKRKGYSKNSKTMDVLGCSYEEFKLHIESMFEDWMSWDNYGKYNGQLNYGWDIDHINPMVLAESEEDVIKFNHYTNLQPLCSKTNRDIKPNN